mmetsp:Transcript_33681/g.99246  ORF Transcript_33681/g.99246 Transcript_33681/m.99246 type:complete len:94 (+) Transcript_33681:41-322(+)
MCSFVSLVIMRNITKKTLHLSESRASIFPPLVLSFFHWHGSSVCNTTLSRRSCFCFLLAALRRHEFRQESISKRPTTRLNGFGSTDFASIALA